MSNYTKLQQLYCKITKLLLPGDYDDWEKRGFLRKISGAYISPSFTTKLIS